MIHVLGCITQQHDLRLVALAGVLCFFACASAMTLVSRARHAHGHMQGVWIIAAGVVAGSGIWGTHFVAMLAYQSGFPVAYDPALTILSIIIAAILCGVGFAMSLNRPGPFVGGAVTGAAISAMHYVGMAAVRVPALAIWDWHYVLSSALIGIGAMAFGMQVVDRGKSWRSDTAGALIFTLAICSMHFTGMAAVTFRPDPSIIVPNTVVDPATLAIAVAAVAILIVALGLIGSLVDSHLSERAEDEASRLRSHIAELEATKARLEQTSESLKLALNAADAANQAKSAFLAAMSHELRTPLNAVLGFSEVLGAETFGSIGGPRNKEYVQDIHASGSHLLALINDILDIARIEAGQALLTEETVDLKATVAQSLGLVARQAAENRIHLLECIAPDVRTIRADERRIKQILVNLLGNAVKFTKPGGEVKVSAYKAPEGLILAVADTGIGMSQEDIPLAMAHFGQIDSSLGRKYEGTGLGLPLARQLAELHGGTLTIDSTPNVGTTVTVTLPAERIKRRLGLVAAE